jgi:hypothetical protein
LKKSLLISLLSFSLFAQESSYDTLAKELTQLRVEVDELHTKLNERKEELSYSIKTFARQKADIESSIAKEALKEKQLKKDMAKKQEEIQKSKEYAVRLKPIILKAVEGMKGYIKSSMPFKMSERMKSLEEIEQKVVDNLISPEKALNRIWSFYEDEFRLTKENGLHRQSVEIAGEKRLVDVAKVGMIAMFYRTSDGIYGMIKNVDGNFKNIPIEDSANQDKVDFIYDAYKKQIRAGYFNMPNILPPLKAN